MKSSIKATFFALIYLCLAIGLMPLSHAGQGKVLISSTGIKFATGGISDEEDEVMRKIAKNFTLNLVFTEGSGGKITGVNAVIFNDSGERVFYIKGANPLLHVNLPSGKYRVLASHHGEKQGFVFDLDDSNNKRLILNWKSAEENYQEE